MRKLIMTDVYVSRAGLLQAGTVVDLDLLEQDVAASLLSSGAPLVDYDASMGDPITAFLKQRGERGAGGAPDLLAGLLLGGQLPTPINAPASTLDLYVAPSGKDSNSGKAPDRPIASIGRLMEALKGFWRRSVRVHFASGVYDPTAFNDGLAFIPASTLAGLYFIGDGAGQAGDDGTVTRTSNAAQAGSTVVNVVTLGAFVANEFRGLTLECLTGVNAGHRRTIRSNTATDIAPCSPFPAVPGAGDVYRVFASGVVFELPVASTLRTVRIAPTLQSAAYFSTQVAMPCLGLINVALSSAHATAISWNVVGFHTFACGLYTTRSGASSPSFSYNGKAFIAGATGFLVSSAAPTNPNIFAPIVELYPDAATHWEGWSSGAEAALGASTDVFVSAELLALYGHSGRGVRCISCFDVRLGNIEEVGANNGLQLLRGGTAADSLTGTFVSDVGNRRIGLSSTSQPCVSIESGCSAVLGSTATAFALASTTGACIQTGPGADVLVNAVVTGASSAGYGVDVSAGGRARFAAAPVITGASGDTRISRGAGNTVINTVTAAAASGVQANAAYAADGQGFVGAISGIQRAA